MAEIKFEQADHSQGRACEQQPSLAHAQFSVCLVVGGLPGHFGGGSNRQAVADGCVKGPHGLPEQHHSAS